MRLFGIALVMTGLLGVSVKADTLDRFALNSVAMREYAERCSRAPSLESMQQELESMLGRDRSSEPDRLSIRLDGLPLRDLTTEDFLAVRNLTIFRGAHGPLRNFFHFEMKAREGEAVINRECRAEYCRQKGQGQRFDLSRFASSEPCRSALCVARKMFGSTQGTLILWAYRKFGTNLSPLSDAMADPQGLSEKSLRAIVSAAMLLPEHLRKVSLKESGFFRFLKGTSLPIYKGQSVVANSYGGVFDPIDQMPEWEQLYFFVHEMAHRARSLEASPLDESPDWLKTAGWKNWNTATPGFRGVSKYGQVNAFEDFAESATLYRLDGERLKKTSPARYEFMKKRVFAEHEYKREDCGLAN